MLKILTVSFVLFALFSPSSYGETGSNMPDYPRSGDIDPVGPQSSPSNDGGVSIPSTRDNSGGVSIPSTRDNSGGVGYGSGLGDGVGYGGGYGGGYGSGWGI